MNSLAKVRYWDSTKGIHVEAFIDGFIYDKWEQIYLLSVAGHDSAVKAITSCVISGIPLEVLTDEGEVELSPIYKEEYRIISAKLPSGLTHQVVFVNQFFEDNGNEEKLVFVGAGLGNDPATVAFHKIKQSFPVPLIPEWKDWLYKVLKEEEVVEELQGNIQCLKLKVNEVMLDSIISKGVACGELVF